MNVLVTGGAGYIGCELIYRLAKCADVDKIVVYDNLSRGNHNLFISNSNRIDTNKVVFERGDILDTRKLKKVLVDIDMVYHLAAKVASPYEDVDSHFYEQVNNWGTAELVYAIEEASNVSRVVFLSTVSVYGASKKPLTEDTHPNPRTVYSISKLRGEEHMQRLVDQGKAVTVRCGNVYGYTPCVKFDTVINKFVFEANFSNQITIHGSGKQHRSFIHVDKVVKSLLELRNDKVPAGIYNLTDRNLQVLDVVDVLKEIYPQLEFIFINQHLELRELMVDPNSKLRNLIKLEDTDFKQEISDFKNRFAFSSIQEVTA